MTDYYDTTGFDATGYDRNGFDRNGYDVNGYDVNGYDRRGYDRDGYDTRGYDASGYDRHGFDRNGVDRNGLDRDGYDRDGYDVDGYDRRGYDRCRANVYGVAGPASADRRTEVRSTRRSGGESEVQVSRMVAGGVATVVVGSLAAAVVCWLLQAVRTNIPAETWIRIGAPTIPDPITAALLAAGVAAAATSVALALAVFVADGLRFFRITVWLLTLVWIVTVASEHSWSTWVVSALVIGIPGMAIGTLAPAVRPTLRR